MRVYVGLKDYFVGQQEQSTFRAETGRPQLQDVHSVDVAECTSLKGTYVFIENVKITAQDQNYIDVFKHKDPSNWFQLTFKKPDGAVIAVTEPLVSEIIGTTLDTIRADIGDTNLDSPAFTDEEYMNKIRLAMRRYKGEKNLSFVEDEDYTVLALLTRIDLANIIAFDHAKYFQLQAPEAQLDKSQVMNHYLEVARGLEEYWGRIKKDLGLDSGGRNASGVISEMPMPNVVTATRMSFRAGRLIRNTDPIYHTNRFT